MVLWTLDRSLEVDRFDENNRAAFRRCRIREGATIEQLLRRSRARRVVFKPICDSHRTVELLDAHRDARAVWVYRDFRDMANSAVTFFGRLNLAFVQDLARGGGDWGYAQFNRELITPERERLVQRWCDRDLSAHTAAAVFWYLVNQTFFDQNLTDDRRVILARYEDLVTGAVPEFQRLCRFLDVRFEESMVAHIFSSSVRRRSALPITPDVQQACEVLLARLDEVRYRTERGHC